MVPSNLNFTFRALQFDKICAFGEPEFRSARPETRLHQLWEPKTGHEIFVEPFECERLRTEVDAGNNEEFRSKNSLIDKFLSSDIGRISRNPETEEDEQDVENEVVKKSVEEDNEIVTETLATIYLQQKKYDKALNAFQKLSLIYPEKSVYFASRIKEIEELKNI